jgi:hypothetical protein
MMVILVLFIENLLDTFGFTGDTTSTFTTPY